MQLQTRRIATLPETAITASRWRSPPFCRLGLATVLLTALALGGCAPFQRGVEAAGERVPSAIGKFVDNPSVGGAVELGTTLLGAFVVGAFGGYHRGKKIERHRARKAAAVPMAVAPQ